MNTDQQEVQELFGTIAISIPGSETMHATTFEAFKLAAEAIYISGFKAGYQQSTDVALGEIGKILNSSNHE